MPAQWLEVAMTEAEKEAAAKAEEAKKAEAAKAEADKKEEDDGEDEDDETSATLETLKAQNAKLKTEAKNRRLENKTLKEEASKKDKALAILGLGKKEGDNEDPLEKAQKQANTKLARTMLKAEFMSIAKDAHDPSMVFRAHADELKSIEVDLDNETVDIEALKEKVDEIRKKSPFLFAGDGDQKTKDIIIKKNPDGKGNAASGGAELKQWKALQEAGNMREANEFYRKNQMKILTQMGK